MEQEYPIQDDIWPSRRWNEARTDYIDLSGSDFTFKAVHWGETIAISNQEGFVCYVNPYGNRDAGIPSIEDRAFAKQIINAINNTFYGHKRDSKEGVCF